ncbi:hypothetical protein AX16_008058 [Volvariella volvacea WC 439]|nr:hypothetical protein AX16_008058 [Volvariella volvacea WC 439]
MSPTRLRIDTSVVDRPPRQNSSTSPVHTKSPVSSLVARQRLRSASASSVSSIPITSPKSASSDVHSPTFPQPSNEPYGALVDRSRSPSPVSPIVEQALGQEYVLAMHDYTPQQQTATCLSFRAGQVIRVLNRDPSGWWDGELEGRRGWFPSNYVNTDIGSLTEEEPPPSAFRRRHHHSGSNASATSWTSVSSARESYATSTTLVSTSDALGQEIDSYCPPLMVPLLHGLSLLQTAVRTNRIFHFQPSIICIVSCVRSILTDTHTLQREAPLLQRHPPLSQERSRILSLLGSLVACARKIAEENLDMSQQEVELENMLRLGGQVFAHVRKLLTLAVQCGIEVPEQRDSARSPSVSTEYNFSEQGEGAPDAPQSPRDSESPLGRTPRPLRELGQDAPTSPTQSLRTRNLIDLYRPTSPDDKTVSLKSILRKQSEALMKPGEEQSQMDIALELKRHKPGLMSISSVSSCSSISSQESTGPSTPPPFPCGPTNTAQVFEALRYTHDQFLSTIAAFIGHAHSHSRSSHASSTGHLYDLVREIVEMVCKLLTIVEAVIHHPDVPAPRVVILKSAKEALYSVTSSLAESVRLLTLSLPPSMSDEEEKQSLLRSATGALKAGADCVSAVKVCLGRGIGEKPFIINLPLPGTGHQAFTPGKFTKLHTKASSLSALPGYANNGVDESDHDLTIQAQPPSPPPRVRDISTSSEDSCSSKESSPNESVTTAATTPAEDTKPLPPLVISPSPVEPDLSSPTSIAHTDETAWEGSNRGHSSLEEKVQNGDLPAVPEDPAPELDNQENEEWLYGHDYARDDVAYNSEGLLVGATLGALVTKMTPHDSIVDPAFSAVFFLTFRLFCSPVELVDAIIVRCNITPRRPLPEAEYQLWEQTKATPIRLRVSNFIKIWVETYWRSCVDEPALPLLTKFVKDALARFFPGPAQRILELLDLRRQALDHTISPKLDRSRDPGMSLNPPAPPPSGDLPRPVIVKTVFSALKNRNFDSVHIMDFDPQELARQLAIMECNLYCAIQPEEVIDSGQEGTRPPVNVRAVSSLSTAITGWVAESILDEPDLKKRTQLIRFFIKVANRCVGINNYSTAWSMLAALDSSTISRLQQTWAGVPQKYKNHLDALRKLADHSRNYHEYRSRLRNTAPPAVPFLGLYLTDVTFCRAGNPSQRSSPLNPDKKLINFNRYHKLARIVQDMQRFQVPYRLVVIPEVQEYLNASFEKAKHHGDLEDLYRRSLQVEPRQPADNPPPTGDVRQLFNWAMRSQPQTQPSS